MPSPLLSEFYFSILQFTFFDRWRELTNGQFPVGRSFATRDIFPPSNSAEGTKLAKAVSKLMCAKVCSFYL